MEAFRVAFATDDGKCFIERHFGDARFYDIYEIEGDRANYVKRIFNDTEEEEMHADPKKAKGIAGLLRKENVQVVVSRVFGPNIKRIKKKFVCVVVTGNSIEGALVNICNNSEQIFAESNKGEDYNHILKINLDE